MSKPVKVLVDFIELQRDIFIDRICGAMAGHLFSRIQRTVSPDDAGWGWNQIADRVEACIDPRRDIP